MAKNILFILGALILIIALWGVYQLIGEYIFIIGLIALFILLISGIKKPKFGNKKKPNK